MNKKPIFSILEDNKKNIKQTNQSFNKDTSNERKIRFDKTHPMRFPVTEQEEKQLRILYKYYKKEFEASSITIFLTQLFRYGLRHQEIIKEYPYNNTGKFKTIRPNKIEHELITGINGKAIEWNVSERKAVYRVMKSVLDYLQKGGRINNEEIQSFRPSK